MMRVLPIFGKLMHLVGYAVYTFALKTVFSISKPPSIEMGSSWQWGFHNMNPWELSPGTASDGGRPALR